MSSDRELQVYNLKRERDEAVNLAKAYSLSTRDHSKCLPNVNYPGLGKMDDRCALCQRMDDFISGILLEEA